MTITMNLDEHFAPEDIWMAPALESALTAGVDSIAFDFRRKRVLLTCCGSRSEINRYVTFECVRASTCDVIRLEVRAMREKLDAAAAAA